MSTSSRASSSESRRRVLLRVSQICTVVTIDRHSLGIRRVCAAVMGKRYGNGRSNQFDRDVECDSPTRMRAMTSLSAFAEIAALAGDPACAGMLHALMDGRALTAAELARVAGVTPQTASGHLARLAMAGLLSVEKQGRHRYHRIASPAVAQMMESIMQVTSGRDPTRPPLTV